MAIRRTAWTPRRASVRQGAASNSPLKGVDHFRTFFLRRFAACQHRAGFLRRVLRSALEQHRFAHIVSRQQLLRPHPLDRDGQGHRRAMTFLALDFKGAAV